jgi:hypothetical protein
MHVAERLTPELLHQGLEDFVLFDPELGERVSVSLIAETIGGQLVRQALAEEAIALQHAA